MIRNDPSSHVKFSSFLTYLYFYLQSARGEKKKKEPAMGIPYVSVICCPSVSF